MTVLTTFGATMPDVLLATGRPILPTTPVFVVGGDVVVVVVVGRWVIGVDTAWGILDRSGVRFKFDLGPFLLTVAGTTLAGHSGSLLATTSPVLLLYKVKSESCIYIILNVNDEAD